jgi:hypothetical protein
MEYDFLIDLIKWLSYFSLYNGANFEFVSNQKYKNVVYKNENMFWESTIKYPQDLYTNIFITGLKQKTLHRCKVLI